MKALTDQNIFYFGKFDKILVDATFIAPPDTISFLSYRMLVNNCEMILHDKIMIVCCITMRCSGAHNDNVFKGKKWHFTRITNKK